MISLSPLSPPTTPSHPPIPGHFECGAWIDDPLVKFSEAAKQSADSVTALLNGMQDLTLSFKSDNGGHFEQGKWVTMFSPLLDYLVDKMDIDEPKFEMTVTEEIPQFLCGACTGYETKKRSLGLFTQREIMEIIEIRRSR